MAVDAENLQVTPGPLTPGTEVNGWRILEPLGRGGAGAAYLVEALSQPGEFFVLKMARQPRDERVARAIALLMTQAVHPHVVRLRAYGRWPHPETGSLYFVMDWVPGLPLHTWAEAHHGSIRSVVEKLATVALTLEHLHAEEVLHGDIKPEHILVREFDGQPILINFGVGSYPGAESLTTEGIVPGTPHLRSPEAVAFWRKHSGKPGVRYAYKPTDEVYALGVSAYRVLTGRWPFPPYLAPEELFAAIEGGAPPAPSAVNRRLPAAINDVILRMMARRVRDRFPSCAEVHAALVAAVSFAGPEALETELFAEEWAPAPQPRAPKAQGLGLTVALVGLTALGGLAAQKGAPSVRPQKVNPATGPTAPSADAPPGTECPIESIMNMRRYDIGGLHLRPVEVASVKDSLVIEVRDNDNAVWAMLSPLGTRVPEGTRFHGRLWVRDRLYGRFDRMVLPDGELVPVCLEFWQSEFVTDSASHDITARQVAGITLAEPRTQQGAGRVDIQLITADRIKRWGVMK
jgi:serine/threonine-protein kinase